MRVLPSELRVASLWLQLYLEWRAARRERLRVREWCLVLPHGSVHAGNTVGLDLCRRWATPRVLHLSPRSIGARGLCAAHGSVLLLSELGFGRVG